MKRRHFLQGIAALPAIPAVLVKPGAAAPASARQQSEEPPKVELAVADATAETVTHFFSSEQLAALRKLSDVLMPSINDAPGALAAGVPEFLDFLIGASPTDRQLLYKLGLDALNAKARAQFNKPFADVNPSQADTLLAPLRQPWTYDLPTDAFARFLRAAKQDVRNATVNSFEWNTANSAGGRRTGGTGQYWYQID